MGVKKLNPVEKILNILLDILIFIFGVILLISLYNGIQVKLLGKNYADFFGYSIFEVQTGSMADEINPGDWIIVKKNNSPDLGDIVTYEQNGEYITHRVIEAYKGTFVTKGDANSGKDEPISQEQLVGKVVKILPHFGIFRKTLFNPGVLIALIITVYIIGLVFKKNKKEDEKEGKADLKNKVDSFFEKIIHKCGVFIKNVSKEKTKVEPKIEPKIESVDTPIIEEAIENIESAVTEVKSVNVDETTEEINVEEVKNDLNEIENTISEEDLDKTMYFRSISVDKSELDHSYIGKVVEEEEVISPIIEEEDEVTDEESDSLIKNKLEMLQKRKKKFKNVIEKTIYLKTEEINEIIEILNVNERFKPNEATIKDTFLKNYIDGKYYNYCGNVNVEYNSRNMTLKMDEVINETGAYLIKDYKGSDKTFADKVKKYVNMFTLIMYLEQGFVAFDDMASRKELYKKRVLKCYRTEVINPLNIDQIINKIIKTQKLYKEVVTYTFEKLETNTFELTYNQVTTKKNLYGLELKHNINFSKVFSDYIVDKTYEEGIIAEDKILVLANLLLVKIARNMMEAEFKNKYIMYIPSSLYKKETKLGKLFKLIEDEYAKNNILILIKYEEIIKNKKLIKGLRKLGYKFAIVFDKDIEVKAKDQGILYVADYLFVDKKLSKNTSIIPSIPTDLQELIINDDISSKVGNFEGE